MIRGRPPPRWDRLGDLCCLSNLLLRKVRTLCAPVAGARAQGDGLLESCRLGMWVIFLHQGVQYIRFLRRCRPRFRNTIQEVNTLPSTCDCAVFDFCPVVSDSREEMGGTGGKSDIEKRRRGVTESEPLVICP